MIKDLHVIVRREADGGYVSTLKGHPLLTVRADDMDTLRTKTLELVRDHMDAIDEGIASPLESRPRRVED